MSDTTWRLKRWKQRINRIRLHGEDTLFVTHAEYGELKDLETARLLEESNRTGLVPPLMTGAIGAAFGTRVVVDDAEASSQLQRAIVAGYDHLVGKRVLIEWVNSLGDQDMVGVLTGFEQQGPSGTWAAMLSDGTYLSTMASSFQMSELSITEPLRST